VQVFKQGLAALDDLVGGGHVSHLLMNLFVIVPLCGITGNQQSRAGLIPGITWDCQ
jgi:hypothetical protein